MKRGLLILAVALLFLAGVYGGVALMSQSRLDGYRDTWRREVAAEKELEGDLRRLALRGEPVDGNAAPRYQRLIQVADRWSLPDEQRDRIAKAAAGTPQPLTPDLARLLQVHQGALAELRDTFRYTRCDWQLDFEQGFSGQQLPQRPTRLLADLLLLEGNELAPANWDAAAERYLGAVRYGSDLMAGPYLGSGRGGIDIATAGLDGLRRLLVSKVPAAPQGLAAAATDLDRLGKALPALPDMLRRDRLLAEAALFNATAVGGALRPAGLSPALGSQATGLYAVTPLSFFLARSFGDLDAYYRQMETAAAATDPAARAGFAQSLNSSVHDAWNPLVAQLLPNYYTAVKQMDHLLADLRLVSAALTVEVGHHDAAPYPPEAANLPADPYAGSRLHYQATGYGYRLWSVGENGKDEQGAGDDILLDRK